MKIPAQMDYLDNVLGMTEAYLETFECSPKIQYQIQVSIEELFTNIASYAYDHEDGLVEIKCHSTMEKEEIHVWFTFSDWGIPYNPLDKTDPDFEIPFDEREIGGLGIYMVKKFMDHMEYHYVNGCNQFTIGKKLQGGSYGKTV